MQSDTHTTAIVLHRIKYGESDRILNLLTPEGRKSVLAKGVRKAKSKLAGGIEPFTVSEVVIHEKKSLSTAVTAASSDRLGILTSARMLVFYKNLLTDFDRLDLASKILKSVNSVSEQVGSAELFALTNDCLRSLNGGASTEAKIENAADPELVETYFLFNIARITGEDVNLLFDASGDKLAADQNYYWDQIEKALAKNDHGPIDQNHIKLMRMMVTSPLKTILSVKNVKKYLPEIHDIARAVAQSK